MKGRESGMPEEGHWNSFYDADCVIAKLGCALDEGGAVVEFGSGYGTFTLPVARRTSGTIHALDIEPDLVSSLQAKVRGNGLGNVAAKVRDFVRDGTGLPDASVAHAMAYNILHIEAPVDLLREAHRVLKPGGILSIIHWKHDPSTPRGPSLSIRPRPEQCRDWATQAGLEFIRYQDLSECCDHHYGLLARRPRARLKA